MLAQIWLDILNLKSYERNKTLIDINTNFFDLGGHSLTIPSLITKIQQVFSIELPVRQLFETSTIAQLAECIDQHKQDNNSNLAVAGNEFSYLVPLQVSGDKPNFFIVPGGSGGKPELIIYAKLIYLLGQNQPVYGFQATELDKKVTVEELAAQYIEEMRILQPTGPYIVGGECIGGLVAFEIARQLHSQGYQVELVLIDSNSLQDITLKQKLKRQLNSKLNWIHHRKQLEQKTLTEKLLYLFEKTIGNFDQLPTKLNDENNIRASNYTNMLLKYKAQSYSGHASLIITESGFKHSIQLGWQKLIPGKLTIYQVPGNHDSYLGEYVADTAKQLKSCLDELY